MGELTIFISISAKFSFWVMRKQTMTLLPP